ncbi:MAG: 1,4-dihydroxy-2-naphthoate polyprenyltransferase [Acidimicrobiaceae bacterium]|nr:1,4-dihydroxy-2-naphthoate polyprenyltransferase [Acidimicrobiaceae bacterium]
MNSSTKLWLSGARPRTLPAAIAPVLVGTASAYLQDDKTAVFGNALLALVVSLALQVGVNYANEYADGRRGTDQQRVGPMRLVGSGAKSAVAVKRAALIAFGVAALFGLALAVVTSWWLLVLGVACIAAGWMYTGGPKPYGYLGFGELFVFIFFGVVATTGTTFVIIQTITKTSVIASVAIGSLACALLVINNLRDIPGDTAAGKKTLAVRLGDQRTRQMYIALIIIAAMMISVISLDHPTALFGLVGLLASVPAIRRVIRGAKGRDLIAVLGMTGRAQLFTAVTLSIGLVLAS